MMLGTMTSPFARRFALSIVIVALLACKLFKKEEPAPSASSEPEPAPPASTAEAEEAAAPPPAETSAAPAAPTVVTTAKPKTTDAGAKDAAPATDASSKGPNPACQQSCNAALGICLKPSAKEGGLPTFADPAKCKAAFDACLKACK